MMNVGRRLRLDRAAKLARYRFGRPGLLTAWARRQVKTPPPHASPSLDLGWPSAMRLGSARTDPARSSFFLEILFKFFIYICEIVKSTKYSLYVKIV
jgi:hypothetical protein